MTATWTAPRTWADAELVDATIMNAHVRDNLDYLKARPLNHASDYDNSVVTTSSTSFVDVTGMSVSVTTSGSSRLLILGYVVANVGTANVLYMTSLVDGTNQGDATYGHGGLAAVGNVPALVAHRTAALSNGAHTVKLQCRSVSGASVTVLYASLVVLEVS